MTEKKFFNALLGCAFTPKGKPRFKIDKTGQVRAKKKRGESFCLCPIEEVADAQGIGVPEGCDNWYGNYYSAALELGLDSDFVECFITAADNTFTELAGEKRTVRLRTKLLDVLGLSDHKRATV